MESFRLQVQPQNPNASLKVGALGFWWQVRSDFEGSAGCLNLAEMKDCGCQLVGVVCGDEYISVSAAFSIVLLSRSSEY